MSHARILEFGCAAGGNLVPFAAWHPHARVVGIDLSQVQIDQGRRRIQALGIANLTLLQGDIATMELSGLGQFDFIVCHGVYSWVPEHVQEAILSAFRQLAGPRRRRLHQLQRVSGLEGQGDHSRCHDAARRRPDGPGRKTLLCARNDRLPRTGGAARQCARQSVGRRAGTDGNDRDDYVLHDQLETFNSPCYFLDFGRRCEPYALTYLADAMPQMMFAINYGETSRSRAKGMRTQPSADGAVSRLRRQPHVPAVAAWYMPNAPPQIEYQIDRSRLGCLCISPRGCLPSAEVTRLDDTVQEYGQQGWRCPRPTRASRLPSTRSPRVGPGRCHALNCSTPSIAGLPLPESKPSPIRTRRSTSYWRR